MAELLTLGIFVAGLFISLGFGVPLLAALLFGLVVFFTYVLWKKYSFRQLLTMALSGIKTVKNILITFILIGTLTALWRAKFRHPDILFPLSAAHLHIDRRTGPVSKNASIHIGCWHFL